MLFSWLRKRFAKKSRTHKPRRARLALDILEARTVPAAMYSVQWLGTVSATDNYSSAQAINDKGKVVGYSAQMNSSGIPGQEKAFSWTSSGGMVNLGTLNGNASYAWDVNNNGMIVGWYHYPVSSPGTTAGGGYYEWAFVNSNGTMNTIPGYAQIGGHSRAFGVNDNGLVVGNADMHTGTGSQAFVYDGSTVTFLGTLGGQWSYGMDVNNSGTVVGFADTGALPVVNGVYTSDYHAFEWTQAGGMKDLGTLGGQSYAYGVNASNMVVGSSITNNGYSDPFLYNGATMIDLGQLAGQTGNGGADAINNANQIVGYSGNAAFLYENGSMYNLNNLVVWPSGQTGDTLTTANDINNLGQIVGVGVHNGVTEAYVLTPTTTTGPTLTLPANQTAPATSAAGATDPAAFTASAISTVTANPTVSYSVAGNTINSSYVFPVGTTTVTATATDSTGSSSGTFTVTVTPLATTTPTSSKPTASWSGLPAGGTTTEGTTVHLTASATETGSGQFTYAWTITSSEGETTKGTAKGATASISFKAHDQGSYTLTLTATDANGVTSDPVTATITVTEHHHDHHGHR